MKATYTRAGVEDLLAYMFNGGHWRREDVADPDMPKAEVNPSHLGGNMAEMIDIRRAWDSCYVTLLDHEALYLHYGNGLTVPNVSAQLGEARETVRDRLVADVGRLVDEVNTGRRRKGRRKANLFSSLLQRSVWKRKHFAAMFSDVTPPTGWRVIGYTEDSGILPDNTIGVAA